MATNENSSQRKYLWLSAGAHFTTDFYNGFLAPLLPLIVARLDLSLTSVGLLLSLSSVSNSLLQTPMGLLADRMNRNFFLLFGPLITAIFMGFLGYARSYGTLVTILVMSGIGTAMFHPPGAAVVGGSQNRRRGLAMAIFNTAGALGIALGSLIIVPLTHRFGLEATAITIVPALIFFLASVNLLPPSPHPARQQVLSISPSLPLRTGRWLILILYLMVVIRATTVSAFSGFIPLYVTSQGQSALFGGTALAVFQLFATVGMLVGGHWYDRLGAKNILALSFVFVVPLGLGFIFLPGSTGLPFLALLGFFLSSSTSVNILLAQEILPSRASLMSSIMMGLGWGVAGILMTPIGAMADALGLRWTLGIVSFFSALGLGLVLLFQFPQKFLDPGNEHN